MKVILTPRQEEMKTQIKIIYNKIIDDLNNPNDTVDTRKLHAEMGDLAHELHMQLSPEPKHHKYMIENREMSPSHPKFYYHVHPVEDLLAYLEDTTANDDPIDITLDENFTFKIYTKRWGHYDTYQLTRNLEGWYISYLVHKGQGGKNGEPILTYMLRHDNVSYPSDLSNLFEDIWYRAKEEGLSKEKVQEMLDEVAEWASTLEKNYPRDISR